MLAGCSPRRASNFSLAREKSPKARLNAGARGRTQLRAGGAPFGQPPRVSGFIRGVSRHIASLVPVNLATSRDMVREWRADFDCLFIGLGSRLLERTYEAKRAVELVAPTPRQPLRRDAKPQTVFVYGKASQQSMRGCIGVSKRATNQTNKKISSPKSSRR